MTAEELVSLLTSQTRKYPYLKPPSDLSEAFWEEFCDEDVRFVRVALTLACKRSEKFFPGVLEVRKELEAVKQVDIPLSPDEAWEMALAVARIIGPSPGKLSNTIRPKLHEIGVHHHRSLIDTVAFPTMCRSLHWAATDKSLSHAEWQPVYRRFIHAYRNTLERETRRRERNELLAEEGLPEIPYRSFREPPPKTPLPAGEVLTGSGEGKRTEEEYRQAFKKMGLSFKKYQSTSERATHDDDDKFNP